MSKELKPLYQIAKKKGFGDQFLSAVELGYPGSVLDAIINAENEYTVSRILHDARQRMQN